MHRLKINQAFLINLRSSLGHMRFVVDRVALGQVFFEYFGFPYHFSFHLLLPIHLSSGPATIGTPSGPRTKWTHQDFGMNK
jgi:hypothetical protein